MYKGVINAATAVTAGTDIPFVDVIGNAQGGALALPVGLWDVDVDLVVTGVAGTTLTAQLYKNGVAVQEAQASHSIGTTVTIVTLPLHDIFPVVASIYPNVAKLSVRLNEDATINSGIITARRIG